MGQFIDYIDFTKIIHTFGMVVRRLVNIFRRDDVEVIKERRML